MQQTRPLGCMTDYLKEEKITAELKSFIQLVFRQIGLSLSIDWLSGKQRDSFANSLPKCVSRFSPERASGSSLSQIN